MAKRRYDPLDFVPSPDIVLQKLTETLGLAERLHILLDLSKQLHAPSKPHGKSKPKPKGKPSPEPDQGRVL